LAGTTGAFLKLGMIASLLVSLFLAASGVGYYYAIYLPQRGARLEQERATEKARAEVELRFRQQRLLAQQQESEQRRALARATAETRYQACIDDAAAVHDASWAAECKNLADKTGKDRDNCLLTLKLPAAYCDASYPTRDASPKCTLPLEVGTVLDAALERGRYRCQREREAAEQ
jgi:hypothetical protein